MDTNCLDYFFWSHSSQLALFPKHPTGADCSSIQLGFHEVISTSLFLYCYRSRTTFCRRGVVLRACRVVDHEVDGGSASIMICANKLSWRPGGWSAGNSEPSPLLNRFVG